MRQVALDFDLTETAVRQGVVQAERDAGTRADALTTDEREALTRLRRETRRRTEDVEILERATSRFHRSEQQCWLGRVCGAKWGRPGMSDEMKADLWRREKTGESIGVISRGLGKPSGSVSTVLKHDGGIAPEPRKACGGSLVLAEREKIPRGLHAGESCPQSVSACPSSRIAGRW